MNCPICSAAVAAVFRDSPYWTCPMCDLWFQHPAPPKVFEADHELDASGATIGHLMSESDKAVNRALAEILFRTCLAGKPARTLDVGSKYPYLARCLRDQGCDAFGMDGIDVVPDYAQVLEVPMVLMDFEASSDVEILKATRSTEAFSLITMIHVFEHMYEPKRALRKLRQLVKDDGRVFLRLPDHGVSGFERDLTPGHYTIHPFFHCLDSLLELLAQTEGLFTVERTYPLEGTGQRDLILKPISSANKRPKIVSGMIVKNEERDLPRCLRSLVGVVDDVVIVDTGSTDRTLENAKATAAESLLTLHTSTYTGASEQDASGEWRLYNFGQARNVAVEAAERIPGATHYLWMDADDELLTPARLRRTAYLDEVDVLGVTIDSGGPFIHHRMWRMRLGIRFEGACHEYPTHGGRRDLELREVVIRHDAAPNEGASEGSNDRNLRILEREVADKPTPRNMFYLAQTHHHGERYGDAVTWYRKRIEAGEAYRDEWIFAYLFKGRCERAAGDLRAAERTLLEGLSKEPGWAELWMELSYMAQEAGQQHHAIGYALRADNLAPPPTGLWRETNKYTDQPPRIISWSYEYLGDLPSAVKWAVLAKERIGEPDEDWEARIARLEAEIATPARASGGVVGRSKPRLALNRPGAIGDILMTLNLIPQLREANPDHEIHYACHPSIGNALREIMTSAGVDVICDSQNFRFDRPDDRFVNLVGYPVDQGYPEVPMTKHLIEYFAVEMGLGRRDPLPALYLDLPPRPALDLPEHYVTLQVKTGWSAYKNWPIERWQELLRTEECRDVPFVQIGAADEPKIPGADHRFLGSTLSLAIALVANATLHVGLDSFANHLTHYFWMSNAAGGYQERRTPGVILWGSTQPSALGYDKNVNICLGLPCQPCFREDPAISKMPRGPCTNPPLQIYAEPKHACMHGIDVARVAVAVRNAWASAL